MVESNKDAERLARIEGMLQDLQREAWTEERVNARLGELMGGATDQVLARADAEALSLREAAYLIGVERVVEAEVARGYR